MNTGNIHLRPLSAKLIHNTEHFSKMAPYVKFKLGDLVEKTVPAKKMHLNPVWEDELIMRFNGETMLDIEVWHKDLIKDDLIGSGSVSLMAWMNKGGLFSEWIPLFYNGGDAGSLLLEMSFTPLKETLTTGTSVTSQQANFQTNLQTNIQKTPIVQSNVQAPIVHTEEVRVQEAPTFLKETPVVYEKEIVREQPIITEKQFIETTQPVIINKPEFHENIIQERAAPTILQDKPVIRTETASLNERPFLEGKPVVHKETEFQRETPIINKERPELYKKEVITEKPIIHEKDIINVEKPIIVEKPEFIQKAYDVQERGEVVRDQPVIHPEKVLQGGIIPEQANIHVQQAEIRQAAPSFVKETAEVFEKKIVHEKPIIHEQPIVHAQKEVVVEKPEVLQTRVFHQEKPIVETQPVTYERHLQEPSATLVTEKTTTVKPKGDMPVSQP